MITERLFGAILLYRVGGGAGCDGAGVAALALHGVDYSGRKRVAAPVGLFHTPHFSVDALHSIFISVYRRDDLAGDIWPCVFVC